MDWIAERYLVAPPWTGNRSRPFAAEGEMNSPPLPFLARSWSSGLPTLGDPGLVRTFPLVLALLLPIFGTPAAGQSCIGSTPTPNAPDIALRITRQNKGSRLGGRASVNIDGLFGLEGGVAGGKIDEFATGGSEVGVLLWVSPRRISPSTCLFTEYVSSEEDFRNAMEQDRGTLRERWLRFGVGFGVLLGKVGGSSISVHAAPEVIARKANLKGRALQADTAIFVLETKRQNVSTHFGGRWVFAVRRERTAVLLFFRNRPRIGADLEWGVQFNLPL